jgi:putative nucleotidyltransferase with HDIG domain
MKELIKTKVAIGNLQIGMKVVELDRSWLETDFMMQGFIIENQDDIDDIARQCEYVWVEGKVNLTSAKSDRRVKSQGLFARQARQPQKQSQSKAPIKPTRKHAQASMPSPSKKVNYINKIPVNQELTSAKKYYQTAKAVAKNIMDGVRIGLTLDFNEAREVVDEMVDSVLRNDSALIWMSRLKNKDEYTVEHCLNVCILSITFARFLGHDEAEIRKIGLCGLLHDVGKAKIPVDILNKPGRFTDDEYEIMKHHTTHGSTMLASLPQQDLAALDVALSHHERPDGKGYPRGLQAHQIPYYAKIICIADTYDAITSTRVYDDKRTSQTALDIIFKNRGKQFDEELAIEFVKCIGLYPPGSLVEMKNKEIGIVLSSNTNSAKPKVLIVLDRFKKAANFKVVNLQLENYDDHGLPYGIAREIPNKSHGIDIKQFIEKGLQLKY